MSETVERLRAAFTFDSGWYEASDAEIVRAIQAVADELQAANLCHDSTNVSRHAADWLREQVR